MSLSVTRAFGCTFAALALLVFSGCSSGPQRSDTPTGQDDFGEDLESRPIDERTISETEMLHRNVNIEAILGGVTPVGNFDWGVMAGIHGEIEAMKNAYWGIGFDWVHQEVTDGVTDIGIENLNSADADQWLASFDRYDILGTFNYDFPLTRDFLGKDMPLYLRAGLGMGMAIVDPETDPVVEASGYNVEMYYGFLLRPQVALRWQLIDHLLVSLGIGYDFIIPEEIDVRDPEGKRQTLDSDISFSTFFFRAGLVVQF